MSSVLLSIFGIFGGFRGGFAVTAITTTVITSAFLLGEGYKCTFFSVMCFLLSIGVSLSFLFTSNGAVRFWSFVSLLALNSAWFVSTVRQETDKDDFAFLAHVFSPVGEGFCHISTMFRSLFAGNKQRNHVFGKVLLGIGIALPFVFIIVPLLMRSDDAFRGMMNFLIEQTMSVIFRIAFGATLAVLIVSYALSLKKNAQPTIKTGTFMGLEPTITLSFLSVLVICYISYLFSQLAYFFEAFRGFLPDGYEFNVASYARRGFFEMCVIAAINFAVIYLCRLLTNRRNKKAVCAVNALSTFVGIFTLLIIATALSKMALYITSFGMTQLRITTSAFMLFLAVVFIALMLHLFIEKIHVIKTAFVSAAVVLILLGTVNVNTVVAAYNYTAYQNGTLEEIDVETIAELGDEGIPYLVLLAKDKNDYVAEKAKRELVGAYSDYYELDYREDDTVVLGERLYTELGERNIPRQKAYDVLDDYFDKHPDVLTQSYRYNEYD